MPVQQDVPTGVGAQSDWTLGAGESKVAAVAVYDGDTTFLSAYSGGRWNYQLFTFPTLAGMADPLTSVMLQMSARKSVNGSGAQSLYFMWDSAPIGINKWPILPIDYTYDTPSHTITTPTLAAANGQHGFTMSAAGGPSGGTEIWVSYLLRTVTFEYTAVDASGFAYLVGSLVLGMIGPGLLFRGIPAVARIIHRIRGLLIQPHEYGETYRRLRALTFPKHFVLGA